LKGDEMEKCDFICEGKENEPVMMVENCETGHRWVFHVSCMKQHLEICEDMEVGLEVRLNVKD